MTDLSRRGTIVLAALALAFAQAACGGDGDDEQPAPAPGGEATAEPADGGRDDGAGTGNADGRGLFASSCGSCHTLAAAGTGGQIGPNLDELKPDRQRVLQAIQQGPGQMPENLYEGAEADAVAQYVAENAGG